MSDTFTSARGSLMHFLTSWDEKVPFLFFVGSPILPGGEPEKSSPKLKRRQKKSPPAVKASLGVREKSIRLAVFFGRALGGHFRRKFSFDGFQDPRINIIEEGLILAQDERWRHA